MVMYCKQCGSQLSDSAKYCKVCGCKVDADPVSETGRRPQRRIRLGMLALAFLFLGSMVYEVYNNVVEAGYIFAELAYGIISCFFMGLVFLVLAFTRKGDPYLFDGFNMKKTTFVVLCLLMTLLCSLLLRLMS